MTIEEINIDTRELWAAVLVGSRYRTNNGFHTKRHNTGWPGPDTALTYVGTPVGVAKQDHDQEMADAAILKEVREWLPQGEFRAQTFGMVTRMQGRAERRLPKVLAAAAKAQAAPPPTCAEVLAEMLQLIDCSQWPGLTRRACAALDADGGGERAS